MQPSPKCYALVKKSEGYRDHAYQDGGGVWTIGYGHTANVKSGDFCTLVDAVALLIKDIDAAAAAVNRLVHVTLTQNQFDAMVDFVFNLGVHALEHSTLLKLLNNGSYADAAREFEKWDHDDGKVVAGLLRRRQAERALFEEG